MNGEDLKELLDGHKNAKPLSEDKNLYLVSYRFDTGAEIAFDPRTTTKCSIFIEKLPERMQSRFPHVELYPPTRPTTALKRVSHSLASSAQIFKVDIPNTEVAIDLLNWIRWA